VKYFKYLKYILKHKWFVFVECCKRGHPILGLFHDISKLLPSEFFPYLEYFYGGPHPKLSETFGDKRNELLIHNVKFQEEVDIDFDLAWLYHQHKNPHHWQYWILREDYGKEVKVLEMPIKYIDEMISDWIGAGKAIYGKDNTLKWYKKNKDHIILHPTTRKWVEYKIGAENERF
jgi:hypothetical protein